jgi:uncharacterized protein with GYD domain
MPKYLFEVAYTADGTRGLLKEGGSSRRAQVEKMVQKLGGRLEVFYYAFGERDVFTIVDLPDAATAAALSLTVGAAGAAKINTVVLLAPEDIDKATKKSVDYRAPGA